MGRVRENADSEEVDHGEEVWGDLGSLVPPGNGDQSEPGS